MDKKSFSFYFVLLIAVMFLTACPGNNARSGETAKEEGKRPGKFYKAPKAITEVDLQALDGEPFAIADFEGKVVLVNLWATWCAPCIEEMPYFNKLNKKFGDDGFVMIGLNSDNETEKQVKEFVAKQELNYMIGWTEESVVREFFKISKLPGIPQSLLLNRNGEMIGMYRGGGPNVIRKMVEAVEKEMKAEDSIFDEVDKKEEAEIDEKAD